MLTEIRKNAAYRYTTWWADVRRGSEEEVERTREGPQQQHQQQQRIQKPAKRTHTHTPNNFSLYFQRELSQFHFFAWRVLITDYMLSTTDFPSSFVCKALGRSLRRSFVFSPIGLSSAGWPIRTEGSRKDRALWGGTLTRAAVCASKRRLEKRADSERAKKANLRVRVKVCCRFMTLLLSLRRIFMRITILFQVSTKNFLESQQQESFLLVFVQNNNWEVE